MTNKMTWKERQALARSECEADDRVLTIDGVPHVRDTRYYMDEVWRRADGSIDFVESGLADEEWGEEDDEE